VHKAIKIAASILFVGAMMLPLAPAGAAPTVAQPYTFMAYDVPGAAVTQIYGINSRGDVVGSFIASDASDSTVLYSSGAGKFLKQCRGFLLEKDGEFTPLDYPSEQKATDYTVATAISSEGEIVGYYASKDEIKTAGHGFLLNKQGDWSTYDYDLPPVDPLNAQGLLAMTPSPFRIAPNGRTFG
jgi:hypothetical protein